MHQIVTQLFLDVRRWRDRQTPRTWIVLAIKLAILGVFLVATNLDSSVGKRSLAGYAAFFGIWMATLVAIVHVAFLGGRVTRAVWSVLLVVSAIVGVSYQAVYDQSLTLSGLEQLLSLIGFVGSVAEFYGTRLAVPVALCLLGLASVNMPPAFDPAPRRPGSWRRRLLGYGVQGAPILLMMAVLYAKNGLGTNGLATEYTSLAYMATLGVETLVEGKAPVRDQNVKLTPAKAPQLSNVVLIMDESIRGDLLDLNRKDGAVTGLAKRVDVVNFGLMSSISNCSRESNVAVRYGVGRTNYLRQLKTNPSLFDYAAAAGYATWYFDGQRTNGLLQNDMDARERGTLTGFVQVPASLKVYERDVALATEIRRTLDQDRDGRKFIYVNKMGAHYPYEGKYPAKETLWAPTVPAGIFGNEPDTGCGCHCGQGCRVMEAYDGKDLAPGLRQRIKNSYMNAVSWNTRRFFEILLDGLNLSNTIVVYMSDHGQDFHDDGHPGLNTHCTPGTDANPDEGKVPLVVLTGNTELLAGLRAAARSNFNRTSQFSVFPSVLHWMGYARADIAHLDVDPPIEEPLTSNDHQRFLSLFFVRLGAKPIWTSINRHPAR